MDDKVIDWLVMKFGFLVWSKNSLRNMQEGGGVVRERWQKTCRSRDWKDEDWDKPLLLREGKKIEFKPTIKRSFSTNAKSASPSIKYRIIRAEKRATLDSRLVVSENFQNAGQYVPIMRRCLG